MLVAMNGNPGPNAPSSQKFLRAPGGEPFFKKRYFLTPAFS
jgi:hypothetical protein